MAESQAARDAGLVLQRTEVTETPRKRQRLFYGRMIHSPGRLATSRRHLRHQVRAFTRQGEQVREGQEKQAQLGGESEAPAEG